MGENPGNLTELFFALVVELPELGNMNEEKRRVVIELTMGDELMVVLEIVGGSHGGCFEFRVEDLREFLSGFRVGIFRSFGPSHDAGFSLFQSDIGIDRLNRFGRV